MSETASALSRKIEEKIGGRPRNDFDVEDFDFNTVVAEVIIFSKQVNVTTGEEGLVKKIYILNDRVIFYSFLDEFVSSSVYKQAYSALHDRKLEVYSEFQEISIAGIQIEEASVYGRKLEMSFSEYNDLMWNNIRTGDIIMVRAYNKEDLYGGIAGGILTTNFISLDEYVDGLQNGTMASVSGENIDFVGIITNINKDMGGTEQFRIQAVDIIRILQQLNVSVADVFSQDKGFKANNLISLFLEAYYDNFVKSYNKELEEYDKFIFTQSFDDLLKFKDNVFDKALMYEFTTDNPYDPSMIINFVSPLVLVQFTLKFILEKMGLKRFLNIDLFFSDEFRDLYLTDIKSIYDDSGLKAVPYIMFVDYFRKSIDVTSTSVSLKEILSTHMVTSINHIYDFVDLDEFAIYRKKGNVFFYDRDEDRIEQKIAEFEHQCNKIITLYLNNETLFKQFNDLWYNDFISAISGTRIQIRSAKFKSEGMGSAAGITQSIPISQLIYSSLAYLNYIPVYNNIFDPKRKGNATAFNSYNYMYSLAQSTWLRSFIAFSKYDSGRVYNRTSRALGGTRDLSRDKFNVSFLIEASCTPLKYSSFSLKKSLQSIDYLTKALHDPREFTSEMLEYEFNSLDLGGHVLFLTNRDNDGVIQSTELYGDIDFIERIYLEGYPKYNKRTDTYDFKASLFNNQTLNRDDPNRITEMYRHANKIVRFTYLDYNNASNRIKNTIPHYYPIYVTGTAMTHLKSATTTRQSYLLWSEDWGDDGVISAISNPLILPNRLKFADDLGLYIPQGTNTVLPFPDLQTNFDTGSKIEYTHGFVNLNNGVTVTNTFLNFNLKFSWSNSQTTDPVNVSIPLKIVGIKSFAKKSQIKNLLDKMFYKDYIPKGIYDLIKMDIRRLLLSVDNSIFRETIPNKMSVDDVIDYLKGILDIAEDSFNNGNSEFPLDFYIMPDMASLVKTMYGQMGNMSGVSFSTLGSDTERENILKFIQMFYKLPLQLDVMDIASEEISTAQFEKYMKGNEITGFINMRIEREVETSTALFDGIYNLSIIMKELFSNYYSYSVFIQDVLRKNYNNGSLYLPNRGLRKRKVGEYIYLVDDRAQTNLFESLAYFTANVVNQLRLSRVIARFTSLFRQNPVVGTSELHEVFQKFQDVYSNNFNSIFSVVTRTDAKENWKPYGWFVWKTITYIGDASGGGGGTSGFTQKVYLARDGVIWQGQFDEKDFISRLAAGLSDQGYDVVVPEYFTF
jgi:hypothetical protein